DVVVMADVASRAAGCLPVGDKTEPLVRDSGAAPRQGVAAGGAEQARGELVERLAFPVAVDVGLARAERSTHERAYDRPRADDLRIPGPIAVERDSRTVEASRQALALPPRPRRAL